MVIARGTSPDDAASSMIDKLELASCKASIVMIPVEREGDFEGWHNRLLDEETSSELLKKLDISAIRS